MNNIRENNKKEPIEENVKDETCSLHVFKESLECKISALELYICKIRASLLNVEPNENGCEDKSAVSQPFFEFLQTEFGRLKNDVASNLNVIMNFIFNDGECEGTESEKYPDGISDLNYITLSIRDIINVINSDLYDIARKFGCDVLGEDRLYDENYIGIMQEIGESLDTCICLADTIYKFVEIKE